MARREEHAVAIVEDDGCGFDPEAVLPTANGQLGLIGLRERVAQSVVRWRSSPGREPGRLFMLASPWIWTTSRESRRRDSSVRSISPVPSDLSSHAIPGY